MALGSQAKHGFGATGIPCYQSDSQGLNGLKSVRQLQNDVIGLGYDVMPVVEVTQVFQELHDSFKIEQLPKIGE